MKTKKNGPMSWVVVWGLCLIGVAGCESISQPSANPGGNDGGADADSDGDSDSDSDSDGDSDAGNDCDDSDTNCINGCEGVDFLFVIDNSGSMEDEQQHLIDSFPGFIDKITKTLELDDFHIMVTSTNRAIVGENTPTYLAGIDTCKEFCESKGNESQYRWCYEEICDPYSPIYKKGLFPIASCAEWLGVDGWKTCDAIHGSGHLGMKDALSPYPDNLCPVKGGARYIQKGQPDLVATFNCIANLGIDGNQWEKPMQSMVNAVGPLNETGNCNEGFVRPNAALVVVFITDENETIDGTGLNKEIERNVSLGDPASWKQALVDAKDGNLESIVVIGIFGDNDLPDGICTEYKGFTGAQEAPRLRTFVNSFNKKGKFCSVCLPDYSDCFAEAINIIDTACEDTIVE